ncbi:response regulator [Paenibacillus sp. FSL R10-2734]|uniref:response regulator transcription factor n=1 Tax=Paenibacillus sp. FSL R10-2734 TaxID=2954691 RepID=UPI0030DB2680
MLRLLVVDDEWLIRKGIVRMIERLCDGDMVVEEAANGKEAIERIQQSQFDLIFCDIKMPELDGIQTLEELTRLGFRVPVVFLTGFNEFSLVQHALRLRAYDYLLKPVQDEDFLSTLAKFKQDFLKISTRSEASQNDLQRFEFKLLNALESLDVERASQVIEDGQVMLSDRITFTGYVDEIVRITSFFFSKHRIVGFDKELRFSSNDLCNLSNLQHAVKIRMAHIREQGEDINSDSVIIKKVKEHINEHLQDQLTLTGVAEFVHFNPTYFSEYFKEKSGETFIQYVTRVKIEKAKSMLADPLIKINDISDCLGYQDPRSFSKMFKLFMGITPTEYRNLQLSLLHTV